MPLEIHDEICALGISVCGFTKNTYATGPLIPINHWDWLYAKTIVMVSLV